MKKVVDAIRYGIETLGVSPEKMFSLIKSSNEEVGLNWEYDRWLAREIIRIAEKENVGYSQLLVKKFSIIQELLDGVEVSISSKWVDKFSKMVGGSDIYSFGVKELGIQVEGVDFGSLIDYDELNTPFLDTLPEGISSSVKAGEPVSIVARLSDSSISKSCDLVKDAKSRYVRVSSEGGAILYRMCTLVDMFSSGSEFTFAFFVNTDFLSSESNAEVISFFLKYFKYEGIVVHSTDLFDGYAVDSDFAFVVCKPLDFVDEPKSYFELPHTSGGSYIYSRSSESLLDRVLGYECSGLPLFSIESGRSGSLSAVTGGSGIPVYAGNLEEAILYYSVYSSLTNFGLPGNVNLVMTGSKSYTSLFASCLVLFAYDIGNKICLSGGMLKEIEELLSKYSMYFSYEAKELIFAVDGLFKYADVGMTIQCMLSIEEVKQQGIHTLYLTALNNLKSYIKSEYRGI